MDTFYIKATPSTPYVNFDPVSGRLDIKGRSIPENSVAFYKPLLNVLDEFAKSPVEQITVIIQLEYYNSSSAVCLLNFLKKLETLKDKIADISIEWYYEEEDEDSLTAGENFQSILSLPVKIIKIAC